jgi:hypothetical protein
MRVVQNNKILGEIEACGLDLAECKFTNDPVSLLIRHPQSQSEFFVGQDSATQWTGRSKAGDGEPETYQVNTWSDLLLWARVWAREVKDFVDTPDRLAELRQQREFLTSAPYKAAENTPFNPDEQAEITQLLARILEAVQETNSLTQEQTVVLREVVAEAAAAARGRIGRKEWLERLFGKLFIATLANQLPAGTVQHIITLAFHGLGYLFGGWGGPPQLMS